jgi:hypothetical protein
MSYRLYGLDKLEFAIEDRQYKPIELNVLDGEKVIGKVHSSQLSLKAANRQDNFELRRINKDTIQIKDLSIYKYSYEKIKIMSDRLISFRFVIPAFQRGYRWETEQVHELLDDIYTNFKKYYNNPELPEEIKWYCIQPLVLKQSDCFLNEYRVIDGQQRLTTITLLLEALNNQVPDENIFHAFIPISYESRSESGIFLNNVGEMCRNALNSVKISDKAAVSLKERVEITINYIEQKPTDLNSRYMLNTYLYAYWYFWDIINANGNGKDYFSFVEKTWDNDEQKEPKRFGLLAEMLLELTSVIWYTIDNDEEDEHKIFEDFNSGKINLTSSELVKGIFMNPDNYIDSYVSDNSLYKQLEVRQTMLGGQWDDIERILHNDEFWSFVPHQGDQEGELDKSTHIDSIFNMYVYFFIMEENSTFNVEDPLFSFKKINEMIINRLASSDDKFKTMLRIWLEIKTVYTTFHEWFIGDNSLKNINSLYHRISLLKRIVINKQWNYKQRYLAELKKMNSLYNKLTMCGKKERENLLNIEIVKALLGNDEPQSNDLKEFIKSITYDNDNAVEAVLLAFNLGTLEGARAYGGRFPFNIFDKQKWHKEHIFATNTEISGENSDERELYKALVSENEIKSFEKYSDLLNADDKPLYGKTINEINSIINNQVPENEIGDLNTRLLTKDGDILRNILRDNHMGNMALLPEHINISISNKSFKIKLAEITQWFKKGDFIPICTMNVFSDFYSNDESYSTHWLYSKRLSYLEQMVNSVKNYFFGNEGIENDGK